MTTAAAPDPKILRARHTLEAEQCRRSAHFFIFDSRHLKTKDEHDLEAPVKAVPDLPYLRVLLDLYLVSGHLVVPERARFALDAGLPLTFLHYLHRSGILFVEKSRDMFVTNLTCCYLHWRGRAHPHQLILVQGKREEDASKLVYSKDPSVGRISFQETHLPSHLQVMSFPRAASSGSLLAPNGSQWRAIPMGAHIIRSEHPSVVMSDEAAFQEEFSEAYTAALPAIEGGGQLLAISSAEPGPFEELVDPEGDTTPTNIPGMSWRLASSALPVLRIHYTADPGKRPSTDEGEQWREGALMRYPGGLRSPRWRKEMEIEYRAFSGLRVFPEWDLWSQGPPHVIRPFAPTGYTLYGSYDHGWANAAAFHVHGINGDGDKVTFWELYADRLTVAQIAKIMLGQDVQTSARDEAKIDPGRTRFEGNPFAGQLRWIVADPSLWDENQAAMSDNTNKSLAYLFARHGVHLLAGQRGGDSTVAEWLLGDLWANPAKPTYRITSNCRYLIWELGQQRYKQLTPHMALTQNQSEIFVDKHNHGWDGLKMWLKHFPPTPAGPKAEKKPGSFAWWRKIAQAAKKGEPVPTYRREMVG